jgi:hypothetical protein
VVNFAPRPLYPLYHGFDPELAWTFLRRMVKNWYRGVERRRMKQCALRNGVTIHKTVATLYDLNTVTPLNN